MKSKIGLIIAREYTSRVQKRSFILMTLLTPICMILLTLTPLLLSQIKDSHVNQVRVIDQSGLYRDVFKESESFHYHYVEGNNQWEGEDKKESDYATIIITDNLLDNPNAIDIYSPKQVTMEFKQQVTRAMEQHLYREKLASYQIDGIEEMIEAAEIQLDIDTIILGKGGEEQQSSTEIAAIVGMLFTFAIYMFLLIYGALVMQSVMQEKSSRIIEVLISSVKPFDLMMGKIIAIGLVGLTQITIWLILMGGIALFLGTGATLLLGGGGEESVMIQQVTEQLSGIDFTGLIVGFVLYFVAGYLLYTSLFAAIGAAVDNETDTQQFMIPVTLIIVFALYAGIYTLDNPDGPLAFWASLFPFTSPIVMMTRLSYGVPLWQIILSLSLLVATAIGGVWVSGRIYRIGILMYGKKPSIKELIKWTRYR